MPTVMGLQGVDFGETFIERTGVDCDSVHEYPSRCVWGADEPASVPRVDAAVLRHLAVIGLSMATGVLLTWGAVVLLDSRSKRGRSLDGSRPRRRRRRRR